MSCSTSGYCRTCIYSFGTWIILWCWSITVINVNQHSGTTTNNSGRWKLLQAFTSFIFFKSKNSQIQHRGYKWIFLERVFHNQDITMEKAWPPPVQSSEELEQDFREFSEGTCGRSPFFLSFGITLEISESHNWSLLRNIHLSSEDRVKWTVYAFFHL